MRLEKITTQTRKRMNNCALVGVNLQRRPDRRRRFERFVQEHQLHQMFKAVQIFNAIDGRAISQDTPGIHLFQPPLLQPGAQPKVDAGLFRTGVVGCALSHYNIWKALASQDANAWFVVCEDDAKFVSTHDGPTHLQIALNQVMAGLDGCGLLYIAGPPAKCECFFKVGEPLRNENFSVPTAFGVQWQHTSMGTVAYAMSQPTAAALCALAERTGMHDAVDWFLIKAWAWLREQGLQVLACWPYLMYNMDTADSNIQSEFGTVPLLEAAWRAARACESGDASPPAPESTCAHLPCQSPDST
jgi:GR25 family glycosyltransferase involved in LPS biosynthesis